MTKQQEEIRVWMQNNLDKVIELAKLSAGPWELQARIIFEMAKKRPQLRVVGGTDAT